MSELGLQETLVEEGVARCFLGWKRVLMRQRFQDEHAREQPALFSLCRTEGINTDKESGRVDDRKRSSSWKVLSRSHGERRLLASRKGSLEG